MASSTRATSSPREVRASRAGDAPGRRPARAEPAAGAALFGVYTLWLDATCGGPGRRCLPATVLARPPRLPCRPVGHDGEVQKLRLWPLPTRLLQWAGGHSVCSASAVPSGAAAAPAHAAPTDLWSYSGTRDVLVGAHRQLHMHAVRMDGGSPTAPPRCRRRQPPAGLPAGGAVGHPAPVHGEAVLPQVRGRVLPALQVPRQPGWWVRLPAVGGGGGPNHAVGVCWLRRELMKHVCVAPHTATRAGQAAAAGVGRGAGATTQCGPGQLRTPSTHVRACTARACCLPCSRAGVRPPPMNTPLPGRRRVLWDHLCAPVPAHIPAAAPQQARGCAQSRWLDHRLRVHRLHSVPCSCTRLGPRLVCPAPLLIPPPRT